MVREASDAEQRRTDDEEEAGRAARTLRFLVRLNQTLQPLSDPDEIMSVTARMLGEHLGVNRCAYAEVEEDQDHFVITGDYARDTFSIPGRFAMSDFGAEAHQLSLEGVPYVVNDAASDPRVGPMMAAYEQTDIAAVISVPLHKRGRFAAGMAVHQKTPRYWSADEIELVTLVVNRCWESIERARTVRELRAQLELTTTITTNATQALVMMNPEGYCTFVNPAAESLFGRPFEEMRQKPMHDLVHHHRPDGSVYPIEECPLSSPAPDVHDVVREHEDVLIRSNGEYFPVLIAASPIFENGRFAGTVLEIRDITERKRYEESLRESERRLRLVLDSMPQKIFTATPTGEVDYFNPQWGEFTGLSFEEIKAWGWIRFIHPDDLEENVRTWQRSLQTGEPFHFEHRFRRADGEYRWHLSRVLPVRNEAGEIMMWIGANTEVHAIKEAEKALRDADRMKDEFLATLSHELRTPLTSITGWSQLLASDQLSPAEMQAAVEAIRTSATAQSQLIEDVLDVSRITTGKMRLERQPVDLASLIEAAVAAVLPSAEARQIHVSETLDRTLGTWYVDPTRIQQVVWNLLSNAIKFSSRGGRVEVALRGDDGSAVIEVTDAGQGIDPEFLPHVFERFRQGDSSATRAHAGLGLGLSLAKELVELHGGTIGAESERGHGARFIVRLPAAAAERAAATQTAEPPQAASG